MPRLHAPGSRRIQVTWVDDYIRYTIYNRPARYVCVPYATLVGRTLCRSGTNPEADALSAAAAAWQHMYNDVLERSSDARQEAEWLTQQLAALDTAAQQARQQEERLQRQQQQQEEAQQAHQPAPSAYGTAVLLGEASMPSRAAADARSQ